MIQLSYASHRSKPVPVLQIGTTVPADPDKRPHSGDIFMASKFKIKPDEFVRRDLIVRQLWQECAYRIGDQVTPKDVDDKKKYGAVLVVRNIYHSYNQFEPHEAWPAGDNPMIVTAMNEETKETCWFTTNFVEKVEKVCAC
jgi:hypothetical protein